MASEVASGATIEAVFEAAFAGPVHRRAGQREDKWTSWLFRRKIDIVAMP